MRADYASRDETEIGVRYSFLKTQKATPLRTLNGSLRPGIVPGENARKTCRLRAVRRIRSIGCSRFPVPANKAETSRSCVDFEGSRSHKLQKLDEFRQGLLSDKSVNPAIRATMRRSNRHNLRDRTSPIAFFVHHQKSLRRETPGHRRRCCHMRA